MRTVLLILALMIPAMAISQQNAQQISTGVAQVDSFVRVGALATDTTPTYILSGEEGSLKRIPVVEGDLAYSNESHPTNSSMYTLTTSYAYCANVPALTLAESGTYLVTASVAMRYDTATFLMGREASAIVKRTNFGEAQVSPAYSGRIYFPKQLTAARGQAGNVTIPFIYTATHEGEILQIWAKIERLPNNSPIGNAFVYHGDIVAIKLDL